MTKVIKRDSREVDFNESRIVNAIIQAMKHTEKGIDENLALKIAESITKLDKKEMTVEEIQDLVEYKLMASSRKDVAKEYISYRNKRTEARNIDKQLDNKINDILNCNNITNDNANIDQYSFSGREQRIGEEVNKQYSKNNLLRESVKKAYEENYIYIHDFAKYNIGEHNCIFINFNPLLRNGFTTRNGDVRKPNSIDSGFQQMAVAFQCQSQVQFGGVGTIHIDFDMEHLVGISFNKYFEDGLEWLLDIDSPKEYIKEKNIESIIKLENKELEEKYPKIYNYAYKHLDKEGLQGAESFYHNLNTLESRQGSQVPFTSINTGRCISPEGRKITEWLFKASLDGIGKHHKTSIFPISIFQYKKGINDKKGTPNYDLKKLAIKSMSKRIYPNWVNGDFSNHIEDPSNPDTFMATMGCVDGQEIVTYKFNNKLFVEGFERMWNRLSQSFEIKEQHIKGNYYIDLKNVLIFDTKNGFVNVKRIIKNKDKGNWNRIKFSNGRSLLATSDHPLPIINKGRTYVKDIVIGDKITINQKQYNEETINYDIEKAWLLGVILCDGCYDSSITTSIAYESEDDIEQNYKESFKKIYNTIIETKIQERGIKGKYKDLITKGEQSHIRKELLILFEGLQKINRHIPNEVFSWNRESKLSFLAGMIDADGYINSTGHCGSIVQIGSTNKELSLQTMALSQSLGLPTKMYLNHYTSKDKNKIRYRIEFSATIELLNYLTSNKKIDCFTREANITKNNEATVTNIKFLGNINKYSYDVTTDSDYFEVSGIYSHNCRTMIGYDRFTNSYIKVGRGNVAPTTIILPKLGIEYGICLGKRNEPDIEGFWNKFKEILDTTKQSLVDRFYHIASQSPKSAPFMYENGTIIGSDKCKETVYEAMKHGTLAIGYLGLAEMCQALFGKTHDEDKKVYEFALSVIKYIYDYAKKVSEEENLNFGCYATPAESTCYSTMDKLKSEYGIILNITDRDYLTNSHHVPVWHKISIFDKLKTEAPFCKYATSGCITYVELDSDLIKNELAVEKIIDFAMDIDIPYLAFNFPINTCNDCGYSDGKLDDKCTVCEGENIEHLARVTGYLTTDVSNFNKGKKAEVNDRVKHSQFTKLD